MKSKFKLIRLNRNLVYKKILPLFLAVVLCCPLFVVPAFAQGTFVFNQSDFNDIDPICEFRVWSGSGSFGITQVSSGFNYNGTFDLSAYRSSSFAPNYQGLNLSNYGVSTFKALWWLPIPLVNGESVHCSFDVEFDISPITNFLPDGLSCFFSPDFNNFDGFSWLSNWESNSEIYNVPRTSVVKQNVSLSSYLSWFPSEYRNTTVQPNVKTNFNNSFTVNYTASNDIEGIWLCLVGNPIIRNGGNINQFTDHCVFTIKNFMCVDGATNLVTGQLGDINNSLKDLDDSLQGDMNESFDNETALEYEETDAEIVDMFTSAISGTSSYFDIVSSFTATTLRSVRFFGNFITRIINMGELKLFNNVLAVSLSLGFVGTLLGIGLSAYNNLKHNSKSNSKSNNKKKGG